MAKSRSYGRLTADHLVWSEMIEPLAQHYRVLVFDNPGARRSYIPKEDYSLESMSNDIVSLLDNLGIDCAHFMGHSLGASLLMQLCVKHPQKVKKAMLCGGPATALITAKWQAQEHHQGQVLNPDIKNTVFTIGYQKRNICCGQLFAYIMT